MKGRTYHNRLHYLLLSCFISLLLTFFPSIAAKAFAQEFVTNTDSVTVPEGDTARFRVRLSQKPGDGDTVIVTVTRESGDPDISVSSGSVLTFNKDNWKRFKSVTLSAAEDADSINGTALIRVSAPGIPSKNVTATESDNDDIATVSFAVASSSGAESLTPAQMDVTLSPASSVTVTVPFTVNGGQSSATGGGIDYTLADGTLTFNPGETVKTISIDVIDDTLEEGNETVVVDLGTPTNAVLGPITTHTYTITDDDAPPVVSFAIATSSGSESVTIAQMAVILSRGSSLTVTVEYAVTGGTATGGGVDYTLADGTLTFSSGQTERTIQVAIHDDGIDEADETVVVTLNSPVNATLGTPASHTYTINDDDVPITFVTDTGSVVVPEGKTATFQVKLGSQPTSNVTASVTRVDGDADISIISGSSLTFTPIDWNGFQPITLAAAEDPDGVNGIATIVIQAEGIPDKDVIATEADNENNAIIVTAPDGGETWGLGETHEITWLSTGTTGENVIIELIRGGSLDRTIIPSTPNDGSFSWAIPGDITAGDDFRVRVSSGSDSSIGDESDGDFSITDFGQDTDTDGVPDREEKGPEGTDESYDGNSDGIPDSQQNTVASLHTHDGTHYVTLEATGELRDVSAMQPPPDTPPDIAFPYGFFEFVLTTGEQGGPASAILYTDGTIADTYYKFGATPDNFVPHWYEFQFDTETVTGAEFDGFMVTLNFVDGLRGDDDLSANGTVVDQGGPGVTGAATIQEAAGSDCFIATAVFGSGDAPSVIILRRFRDTHLLTSRPGMLLVDTYYRLSPPVAKWLANHEGARFFTRTLLTPVTITCWFVLWTGSFLSLLFPLALLVLLVISGTGKRGRLPRR